MYKILARIIRDTTNKYNKKILGEYQAGMAPHKQGNSEWANVINVCVKRGLKQRDPLSTTLFKLA